MSNEETKTEEKQEKEPQRGPNGEVGKATASLTLKQKWHEATHKLVDMFDNSHPNRRVWVKLPGQPSLKAFARKLAKSGDSLAKDWFEVKTGALNESRNEKNKARISLEKKASKDARRKKSAGKNKITDAAAPVVATTTKTNKGV